MSYEAVVNLWTLSEFTPPTVLLLNCQGKNYAVVSDTGTIITVASGTRVIYAVVRSKLTVEETEDGIRYYNLEDPRYLKVISCTENTNMKPVQKFVLSNIIGNL
jgi:hypothetical protein